MDQERSVRCCTSCKRYKPMCEFHIRATQCKLCKKSIGAVYYINNKSKININNNEKNDKLRDNIFDLLGYFCVQCGESERDFLVVDHIFDDRKRERSRSSITWKQDILRGIVDRSRYQILCRNCNEAKYRLNPIQLLKNRILVGKSKICSICKINKDISEFSTNSHYGKRCIDSSCHVCVRNSDILITQKCYELLGGRCKCCGIDDQFKLNIDHIYNDGNVHRKLHRTGAILCRKILNKKIDYACFQLLCANCNYSKMRHGVCVHALEKKVA
jgi:hypothetical protein